MASSASLTDSVITISLEGRDRAYVSVFFVDPAPGSGQTPKGKRADLSKTGSVTDITAWTNGSGTTHDRHLDANTWECIKYPENGSLQSFSLHIRKASSSSDNPANFTAFGGGSLIIDIDSGHAMNGSSQRIKIKQWTFTDINDKVIVTIVMQDDLFGGLPPIENISPGVVSSLLESLASNSDRQFTLTLKAE